MIKSKSKAVYPFRGPPAIIPRKTPLPLSSYPTTMTPALILFGLFTLGCDPASKLSEGSSNLRHGLISTMRCRPCRNNPPDHHLPPKYPHVHAATGYGPHLPLLSCYSKWSPVMRAPSAIRLLVCGSVLLLAGSMPCSRHYFGVCPPESSPP
jgi:hypothetical protein